MIEEVIYYQVICDGDDCDETGTAESSEQLAIVNAIELGFREKIGRKLSGVVRYMLCPECARKDREKEVENG